MSLDLGAVVGRVVLEDVEFQRTYVRVVRQMGTLGQEAAKSAAGTSTLDDSLAAVGKAAGAAAAGLDRAEKATASETAAADRAAAAERTRAAAVARVAEVMSATSDATVREQQATLRDVAAQERLTVARQGGTSEAGRQAAATAKVASAQAAAVGAAERAASSQSRFTGALASSVKMAAQLGLIVLGMEAVKKAIDITHEASDFQRDMVQIQTQAGASAGEIRQFSGALLTMSPQVAQSPAMLATSLYHVYSATKALGYTGPQMLNAVRVAAEGATASGADLEETTNALTATFVSGLGSVKDMSAAMGALNAIVGAGDMKLADLNDALGTGILVVAKTFGATLAQVGAALDVFGDNNIRGAKAATDLRMAFQDLTKPGMHAEGVLADVGLSMTSLRDDLQKGGLTLALHDLKTHLEDAGITGSKVGGWIEDAFTKKAGVGLAILLNNLNQYDQKQAQITHDSGNFGAAWHATTQTASFALKSFDANLTATGIRIAENVLPEVQSVATWLGHELPIAVSVLSGALSGPLTMAWDGITTGFRLAGDVIGPVINLLGDIKGPLSAVAELTLGMWAAFKAGQFVGAIITGTITWIRGLPDAAAAMATRVRGSVTSYVESMGLVGTSSEAAATTATASMAAIADEAAVMSGAVVEEGDAAALGWAGLLGPLAAVGIGVGLLVTMFHHSSDASKEAAAAAKVYTDALSSDGATPQTIFSTVIDQLTKANLPSLLSGLNNALGHTALNAGVFATAITKGGPALEDLRTHLEGIVTAGTHLETVSTGKAVAVVKAMTPAAQDAAKALSLLNSQYSGLSSAAQKELDNAKSFHVVAASIDNVAQAMKIGVGPARAYAGWLGVYVDKNGVAQGSSKALASEIAQVNSYVDSGSQTVADFTKAWDTFSKSSGTAADRAAIIAATLKAANGDALSYAGAMNAAAVADDALVSSLAQAASSVGKHGESIGALVRSIVNLKTGTIDYNNSAAAPLISSLDGIQQAAMNAASATYQHNKETLGGAKAADAAYSVYVSKTQGSLIDQAKQLGISKDQAAALAKQYFGMPSKVKTLIEQEGANPVVDVLNKIGQQLAYLTGHPWTAVAKAKTDEAQAKITSLQTQIDNLRQNRVPGVNADTSEGRAMIIGLENQLNAFSARTYTGHVGVMDNGASYTLGRIIEQIQYINGHPAVESVTVVTHTGHVVARAAGGAVYGPGSETSDSIPARLSRNEHVWTAAEVRAAGGHGAVEALRRAVLSSGPSLPSMTAAPVRVSMPSVSVGAKVTPMLDMSPVVTRLASIEARLALLPAQTGAAVGDATLAGFTAAGTAQARKLRQLGRKG